MRILIISPHFPPVNSPDLHRVRLLLPYMKACRVEAEVLAVEAAQAVYPSDSRLLKGLPDSVIIHRVRALSLRWRRFPGFGSIGFRAMRALARKGDELLANQHFDLIYFSTTVFEVHFLGVRWKRKFGVPFAMDFQDPWVNDYYRKNPQVRPPGGRIKYCLMSLLHRKMEPRVLRQCSGISSVSPAYPKQLMQRYTWLEIGRKDHELPTRGKRHFLPARVMPFPGDATEFERVMGEDLKQTIFTPGDGNIHWVYAGVIVEGMFGALRALFRALKDYAPKELLDRLRIHFIGTCYAPNARAVVLPLAEEYGLRDLVDEKPARIAYSEVLVCLRDADALLIVGSNDEGYSASKAYPYLLAKKPLLTLIHENSSVVTLMKQVGGGVCVTFSDALVEGETAGAIAKQWLANDRWKALIPLDQKAFEPYTAGAQARKLAEFFMTLIPIHH